MARTVLMSFRDNEAAEAFVRNVTRLQDYTTDVHELSTSGDLAELVDQLGTLVAAHGRVEALFARPTSFCKCPGNNTKGGQKGWYKTKEFGWFVCPTCKKPNRYIVRQWIASHCSGAYNLLPALLEKLFPKPEPSTKDDFVVKGTVTGRTYGPTHLAEPASEPFEPHPVDTANE